MTAFRCHWLVMWPLVVGCGGTIETTRPSETGTGAEVIVGPPTAWADMGFDERRQYMADRVLPTMAELFTTFDAERYADFSCATCHGDDARTVAFHIPNQLPALWPSGTPQQQQMVQQHPDTARFMFNRVLPTMTRLLGQPAWNNDDKTGFSCFNCHARGEDETTPNP